MILLWAPSKLPFNNHNYYCLLSFVYHLYEFKNLQTQLVDDRFSLRDKALHTYLQQEKKNIVSFYYYYYCMTTKSAPIKPMIRYFTMSVRLHLLMLLYIQLRNLSIKGSSKGTNKHYLFINFYPLPDPPTSSSRCLFNSEASGRRIVSDRQIRIRALSSPSPLPSRNGRWL